MIDVSAALIAVWAAKDEDEIKAIRYASKMSSAVMSGYFENEMSTILDEGKKVTHEQLSERIEGKLDDSKMWKKVKSLEGADLSLADGATRPSFSPEASMTSRRRLSRQQSACRAPMATVVSSSRAWASSTETTAPTSAEPTSSTLTAASRRCMLSFTSCRPSSPTSTSAPAQPARTSTQKRSRSCVPRTTSWCNRLSRTSASASTRVP